MKTRSTILAIVVVACALSTSAQDLAPRAYVITPVRSNAITLTWSYFNGGVNFNGAVPITGAKGTYNVPVFSYYRAFSFFGRSANVTMSLPYAIGNFNGDVLGTSRTAYRSGLMDFGARFSVNLHGGPAQPPQEFRKFRQKLLIGASLRVVAPTGQYDGTKLVNWGINRWALKPEVGFSQRWGNWVLDGYAGVWFYTTNDSSYAVPVPQPQTQTPVGSLETHLSYDAAQLSRMKALRAWFSVDGNFWWGGTTALSGIQNTATRQTSSRMGATISIPYTRHQSIKIAASEGTYIRFGGNYTNVQVAWQYSWISQH